MKKRIREIEAVLSDACERFEVEKTKTHYKVTIFHGARQRKLSVSGSPSCRHSINQFRRDVRKVMYELENDLETGAGWGD